MERTGANMAIMGSDTMTGGQRLGSLAVLMARRLSVPLVVFKADAARRIIAAAKAGMGAAPSALPSIVDGNGSSTPRRQLLPPLSFGSTGSARVSPVRTHYFGRNCDGM